MKEKKKARVGGIPANVINMPMGAILGLLLILVIYLVYEVNRSSTRLSDLMERSGVYQQEATELQAGINVLSETVSNFIQMPTTEDGSTNVGPLMAFVEELQKDRRGPQIAERFRGYEVSSAVQGYIDHAAQTSVEMQQIQAHVLALMCTVHPLPPIPALAAIPSYTLTEEELALPDEARVGLARKMIIEKDYATLRYQIVEDIGNCSQTLQEEFSSAAADTRQHVTALRRALWVVIISIIVMLAGGFTVLYFWVVQPLRKHSGEIAADQSMKQASGIREMRLLVSAYNALLTRRNRLDDILRSAAETDSLTGMPNRYSLERYLLESGEDGAPMAVLVFDVNYLKQTNDTNGHIAGDSLLRTAGDCIRECFATEKNDNCYRVGGDEFTAILRNCTEKDIKARLNRFELALEREHISVSVGYAYARKAVEGTFRKLMEEADRYMYENKKKTHENNSL